MTPSRVPRSLAAMRAAGVAEQTPQGRVLEARCRSRRLRESVITFAWLLRRPNAGGGEWFQVLVNAEVASPMTAAGGKPSGPGRVPRTERWRLGRLHRDATPRGRIVQVPGYRVKCRRTSSAQERMFVVRARPFRAPLPPSFRALAPAAPNARPRDGRPRTGRRRSGRGAFRP